jgi:predicted nucleic acid-binding Zn ribbon protein
MTRKPHDQFAKQYLEELLAPLGSVETSREISPEIRQVDVWFVPTPSPATAAENLGLLGRMATTACLLEPL